MQCTGAAKPGLFKWTITCRGPVIAVVLSFNNGTRNRTSNLIENSVVAPKNRNTLERIAFVCTIASATSLAIIIAMTWTTALRINAIPDVAAWQHYQDTGNGPWNHNGEMAVYVDYVFFASAITLVSGLTLVVFARVVGRRLLGGTAITAAVVIMWYHFQLID
jgi:hypothetical protein